jgi:broad specificity phosphatase PhoE
MRRLRRVAVVVGFAYAALLGRAQQTADDLQSKAPAVVFIIRHAEKPTDDKDPHLTAQGVKRAERLPALFLPQPGSAALPRLPRPNALFASAPSKHSDRPIETITPLAQALKLRINTSYDERETAAVAKEVLSGKYAGKVVLICWHHGEIPHLAEAFGATGVPKHWNDAVFDQVWMLEWDHGVVQFSTLPEHLLPGDSAQ